MLCITDAFKRLVTSATFNKLPSDYPFKEFDKIRKEMATCGISISNLKEMINEAAILCRNLRQMWQDGGIAMKEGLQNLLFPNGLVYDKKNGVFRTFEINFIIAQIARHTGDLCKMKKRLSSLFEPKSLSAGSRLQGSNLKKGKNASNQPPTKDGENSIRFTEDLIKLHEFYKNFFREITTILEKD